MTTTEKHHGSASRNRWILGCLAIAAAVGLGAGVARMQSGGSGSADQTAPTILGSDGLSADTTDTENGEPADQVGGGDESVDDPIHDDDAQPAADAEPRYIFADNVLLGTWDGSSWTDQPPTRSLVDGLTATSAFGEAVIRLEPAELCFDRGGASAWFTAGTELRGLAATGVDGEILALRGTSISPAQAHLDVVATQLQAAGLPDSAVAITEVLRIDLENDGVDEVLITASVGESDFYGSRIGDYSMAILRRVNESDSVDNIVLGFSATTGNEPGLESAVDVYGEEAGEGVYLQTVWTWRIASVVDLNGDGVAEIGLERTAYESWGMDLFDVSGRDVADPVLESTCGA